jgi:hypothetical protein
MKRIKACWLLLVAWAVWVPGGARAGAKRELKVHLAQANNNSR